MDNLVALNVCLVGFFAFTAVHYATQWWFSRNERLLIVFAIQCFSYAVFCVFLTRFLRATTIAETQAALGRLVTVGLIVHVLVLQFYADVAGRRDRLFRVGISGVLAVLVVVNQWAPVRGTVLALQAVQLPGVGTRVIPLRTPP